MSHKGKHSTRREKKSMNVRRLGGDGRCYHTRCGWSHRRNAKGHALQKQVQETFEIEWGSREEGKGRKSCICGSFLCIFFLDKGDEEAHTCICTASAIFLALLFLYQWAFFPLGVFLATLLLPFSESRARKNENATCASKDWDWPVQGISYAFWINVWQLGSFDPLSLLGYFFFFPWKFCYIIVRNWDTQILMQFVHPKKDLTFMVSILKINTVVERWH